MCDICLCVNMCVHVWRVEVGYLALKFNVDCTVYLLCTCAHFFCILCSHLLFTQGLHCVTYCLFC